LFGALILRPSSPDRCHRGRGGKTEKTTGVEKPKAKLLLSVSAAERIVPLRPAHKTGESVEEAFDAVVKEGGFEGSGYNGDTDLSNCRWGM